MASLFTFALARSAHARSIRPWLSGAFVATAAAFALGTPAHAVERTLTFRAGPYHLAAFNTQVPNERTRSPHIDGSLRRMEVRLVDRRGRAVPRSVAMLHHIFFRNLSRRRLPSGCAERPDETFFGTGEENQRLDLPRGYGYPVRRGDRWWIGGMVMSHSFAARDVWVEYRLRLDSARRRPVRPFWVRASGCGRFASYGVRGGALPGSVDERVAHWRVPVSGRIVAAGGHLHAGAYDLRLSQPACGDRLLLHHHPAYGPPDHPVYRARPLLHEIGPIATSAFKSPTGLAVHRGEVLDLRALYDAEHPHPGVMAITHLYIAPGRVGPEACPPLPADTHQTSVPVGARTAPPWQPIPLWTLDARRRPTLLRAPTSAARRLSDGGTVTLRENRFAPESVVIGQGDRVHWTFEDEVPHNLTFASGPVAVGGQTLGGGATTDTQFFVPGRYQLFCYLHPMTMHEQVTVLPR